jgi:hypothetical protein
MMGLGYTALQQMKDAQLAQEGEKEKAERLFTAQKRAQSEKARAEVEKRQAVAARDVADHERERAEQQRLRAETQSQLANQQSERANSERQRAENEQRKALANEREARDKSAEADIARGDAVTQKEQAEKQRTRADTQSHLSASRALALTSREARTADLPLVLEAYRLNHEYGGDPDDPELFAAMHAVGARYPTHTVEKLPQKNGALSLALSKDGRTIFAGDESGQISRHDQGVGGGQSAVGRRPPTAQDSTAPGSTVNCRLPTVDSLDGDQWLAPKVVAHMDGPVRTLALRDNLLAAGTDGGRIAIWDLGKAGAPPQELTAGQAAVTSIAFQPSGLLLAAGNLDGTVTLLDPLHPAAPATLRVADKKNSIRAVAWSADGRSVAASQLSGALLWDASQPGTRPRSVCTGALDIRSLAFKPDGTVLLCGKADGRIIGWPLRQGRELTFSGHTASVNSLRFSPHGDTLASGSSDGTIRLWHIDKPEALPGVIPRQEGWVWAVAWSADGRRVISGGKEPSIHISSARSDVLAADLCRTTIHPLTEEMWNRYTDEPYRETNPCADPRLGLK